MTSALRRTDLNRILGALRVAKAVVENEFLHPPDVTLANNGHPATSLDKRLDSVLRVVLPRGEEGWLSEESEDHHVMRKATRVWCVDAVDGTRELIANIPEWTVSIGLIEGSTPVAGGIMNPCTGELYLGSLETGISSFSRMRRTQHLSGPAKARILVSRKELHEIRDRLAVLGMTCIAPTGSVAYRLALVATCQAEITCTFQHRHEWDVAAGVALVHAAGGQVLTSHGFSLQFGMDNHRLTGIFAFSRTCPEAVKQLWMRLLKDGSAMQPHSR
jgi:myo-inositol-1(or 4)-monophosphatase